MSMKAILLPDGPGGPEKMQLGDAPKPTVQDNEVLIKVHTTGINRADTLQRKGLYPPPKGASSILGLECAGVIEQVGSAAPSNVAVGQRVVALLGGGGYAEYVAVDARHVMPIPEGFSFVQAAAIAETWLTAFQLLYLVGDLAPGDKVLVHAAGSSVGVAAIQLATEAGAQVYATAGKQEKLDAAIELGAVAGFLRTERWADKVLEATGGHGVDVILDCVGGSYVEQNSAVLAMEARWVLYGLMGGPTAEGPVLRALLSKRASIRASTLRTRSPEYKADLVARFTETALPLFSSGRYKVLISSVLPLAKAADAHTAMESNANLGKIVLEVIPDEQTPGNKEEL